MLGAGPYYLYDKFLKPLYDSYGGGLESLANPDMYADAGKFIVNTGKDIAQFPIDIGADLYQTHNMIDDRMMEGQPIFSQSDKYAMDNFFTKIPFTNDYFLPTIFTGGNPLRADAYLSGQIPYSELDDATRKLYETRQDAIAKEYNDYFYNFDDIGKPNAFLNEEMFNGLMDKTMQRLPSYYEYASRDENVNNPNAKQEYIDMQNDMFSKVYMDVYGDNMDAYMNQAYDNYNVKNFGYDLDGDESAFREFDMFNYASGGEPLLEYSNPTASELLPYAHLGAELIGPGLIKNAAKKYFKGARGADDGIRSMKTIYDERPELTNVRIPESRRIEYKPNKIRRK
mgnify:FL=1